MKQLILITMVLVFSGCQSLKYAYYDRIEISNTPETVTSVDVSYDFDKFERKGWLSSSYYMSWFESGTNGIAYKYRAFYNSENAKAPQFVQLYFVLKSPSWYFIDKVNNENGVEYPISLVDRDVATAGNIYEYFTINLSHEHLKELSASNVQLKISGKKGEEIFPISNVVTKAFIKSLQETRTSTNKRLTLID